MIPSLKSLLGIADSHSFVISVIWLDAFDFVVDCVNVTKFYFCEVLSQLTFNSFLGSTASYQKTLGTVFSSLEIYIEIHPKANGKNR